MQELLNILNELKQAYLKFTLQQILIKRKKNN